MARTTWHPYAPDQAFGHQAAQDEELLDRAIARLESGRYQPPRAGSKARPTGQSEARASNAGLTMAGWVAPGAGLPVTINVALDAAARLRSEPD
jgi:hypothetical protein